ncbi:hypothetical protein QBC32DRAFT_200529, partial [Pseudoneurospora amorphoporcata]
KGEGPFNYKALLSRTIIHLTMKEFLQCCPDGAKNIRILGTRVPEREIRAAKK